MTEKRLTDPWGFDRGASEWSFAEVGDRIIEAIRRLRRIEAPLQAELYTVDGKELTAAQVEALEALATRESWRMHEIAEKLAIDPSTASRTVAPLVGLGLVARRSDPLDRRYVVVMVTPRGRQVSARIARDRRAVMREIVGRMEPTRRVELAALFEEYLAAHEAAQPALRARRKRARRKQQDWPEASDAVTEPVPRELRGGPIRRP